MTETNDLTDTRKDIGQGNTTNKNYVSDFLNGTGNYFKGVFNTYLGNKKQFGAFIGGSLVVGGALQTLNDALDFGLPHVVFTDKEASDTLKAVEALTDYFVSGAIPLISIYAIDPVLDWIKRLNPKTDKEEAVENADSELEEQLKKITDSNGKLSIELTELKREVNTKLTGIETKIETFETGVMGKLNEETEQYLKDSKAHYETTTKALDVLGKKCDEMETKLTNMDGYLTDIRTNVGVVVAQEEKFEKILNEGNYNELKQSVNGLKAVTEKVVAWTEAKDKKGKKGRKES